MTRTPHTPRRRAVRIVAATFAALLRATPAVAQHAPSLDDLQRAAVARDPRAAQRDLLTQSTALRVTSVRDALKPQFTVTANNAHASDVTYLSLAVPGTHVPVPPRDRWSGALDVSQVLYDGGAADRRQAVEVARLAEGIAGVDAALEPLRAEVAATYFSAALLQASERELAAAAG
ncbi:MAG TPA: TolC family protein, partial [Gemmatimonadaceae bacterium]|nr:TolC family protein [Gemmatimonadaceae bacterium]